MNRLKKIGLLGCVGVLFAQGASSTLVFAETQPEETQESQLSSLADDPREALPQSSQETPTVSSDAQQETSESEPAPEIELPSSEELLAEPPIQVFGGISLFSINLIEGVHIDAQFAQLLRTDKSTTNGGLPWSGFGKGQDQLTDDDMADLTTINVSNKNLTSLTGIEYAINLQNLYCANNQLMSLDVSACVNLQILGCDTNQLPDLDVSGCVSLQDLFCGNNQLASVDVSNNVNLQNLVCNNNQLVSVDVSNNVNLQFLYCHTNQLTSLDVSDCVNLQFLYCYSNQLTSLDVSNNANLTDLYCHTNQLKSLDAIDCVNLSFLVCSDNQLTSLNVSNSINLKQLNCGTNQLTSLDVSNNVNLQDLYCDNNQLTSLDVSACVNLKNLDCCINQLSDITSTNGLSQLTNFNASGQVITIPAPHVSASNQATVDVLKTTAHLGLSATAGTVTPAPTFSYTGDDIVMDNVTRASLSGKEIQFSYDGLQLAEGAASGTKFFSGVIRINTVSDLDSTLEATPKKVHSGEEVEWTWTITSLTTKKAENIFATVALPAGWTIDPTSITKNGSSATLNDLNGTNNLGDLNQNEGITFTFKTTAVGNADEWLEVTGIVDWEDDTIASSYSLDTKAKIKILDEEQKEKPLEVQDLELLSVPLSFRYGLQTKSSTAQTIPLNALTYQTNTNVVTEGFYTRIKDDRASHTGWKLTAQLSDFTDSTNTPMPNGTGASLRLEDLTVESILDRDTPQEAIDPSPNPSEIPSTVVTDETLVAGQTAKTLISAQATEGGGTWQLRMPFDKVSLNLPANAGKANTNYTATLTWSLDDTP